MTGEMPCRKRRLSSFQIIILGFAGVILLGALLLMLPLSTTAGCVTPFHEALFTATSAVCVTGLVVQDTGSYWSGFGQAVILTLIQIGGLGVVTVAASVALLSGRRISLMQRSTMQDAISAPKVGGIVRLTRFILRGTFLIELVGALVMLPVFCRDYGWHGIWMAVFHSVSAFCNAGFDLMGENGAGKSTMMKCLFGTYQKDEGTIYLDGKEVNFSGPKDALENGIAMVHQELNQCLERNVVDNLFLGRYPVNSLGMIDEGRMKNEASELFRKLGMTVNLDQPMRNMSVSQRQMCEIAKAISYNSKVIVLDEPTSSLTVQEVDKLFDMMRMLRDQGISLIYISHKMDEIFEICDDISVLRDGNLVMTKSAKETNMNELITAMVGRVLENRFPPVDNQPKDVILSIQHLSTKYEPYLQDVTFDVREGEIFGLYGLVGAGRTELLETIFGIRTRAAGRVYLNHKLMNFSCAKEAMDYGFALITEERKANGLFLKGNLTFNTTIANLNAYKKGAALSEPKMTKATANEIKVMHTKCLGPNDMISSLSGGNQQKVIFGKWLEREPKVFMMDEPTRGIDVGAKYEIYDLIIQMAKQGKTIIVVSSEMPEILGITNRIGVMSNGRLAGIVNTKETNQEELLRLSAKYL